MYVCLCKGVTDRDIEEQAIQGADYSDVRRELGVATDCGACGQLCKSLLRQYEADAVASVEFSAA
ncbi:(2Fe-2S)-binding protein [Saccharospirillum impatiens]|uniref:(2Fe-2S)-binding protein n=1 Tax=Saccharospirillum impatiens TaxID=169438 RepID=UPI00048B85C2|nr:(2Fe-2S)-binding protein [Saccharospirillum impatiens]